jgi:lipopolysaccharide transport system permease protein
MTHQYLELIWYKTLSELRAESAKGYIGFLWWIIEPIIYMGVFFVIFGMVFKKGGEGFVPFLLCGLVAWKWFSSSINNSANSISKKNAGIMSQVYLPKYIFPTINVITNTIKFLVVFAFLLVSLMLAGYMPTMAWLALPVLIGVQFMLVLSLSWLVSSIVPLFPDFRLLLANIMSLLFFCSGVFFDISKVEGTLGFILKLNPVAILLDSYRTILIKGEWPEWNFLAVALCVALVVLWGGSRILRRYDRIYPKVLI